MKQTSKEAYQDILHSGLLGEMQKSVVSHLAHGSLTGSELDQILGTPSAHKRLSELEKMGVAAPMGERVCRISGRMVTYWALTGQMPKELPKPVKGTKTAPAVVKISKETIEKAVKGIRQRYTISPPYALIPQCVQELLAWLEG